MPTEQAPDRTTESFQGLLLRHRGRTGLTQRQLATRVGVSRRSIQDWEARLNYPDAQHLQALIVAFLEAGGLTVGSEITEAEALWAAALRQAPRMQTPFDPSWWTRLLARRAESTVGESAPDQDFVVTAAAPARASEQRHDWGEAPDIVGFVGRAGELARLRRWIVEERSRLVAVLGIGGIGKSILAAQLAQDVSASFQRVYWRSLRDALPTTQWLAGAIGFLSGQQVVPPDGEAARLSVLLELLRDRRGLLVLDNFETVLEPGQREGRYRDGLAGYGALVQAVGETSHQSCLVVTSREAPLELAALGGQPVRRLELGGLGVSEGQFVLAHKQLSGDTEDWINLISRFGGNGLALKVVGESIREVFGGDIGGFLEESGRGTVFGGIRRLLAEQIERSSGLEQNVLRVLAVEREPVTLGELIDALGPRVGRGAVLEAVEALRRRSLLERAGPAGTAAVQSLAGFTLQSVVLEYVTDRLVEDVSNEIARGRPLQLVDQPLIKAQAKDYVRNTQERLIGEPILQQLQAEGGYSGAEQKLLTLLDGWRDSWKANQGYGPGSLVNLLRLLRGSLNGLDLSRLVLRQVYLAEVEAQDVSLAGAHLSEAVLAESFNFPFSVALSSDGAFLVAGTAEGEVWLWRVADRTPLLALQGHTGAVYGLALSADGRLLASGSEDGTVRLWSLVDTPLGEGSVLAMQRLPGGQLLATLHGHTGGVWGVALSGDGRLLAAGAFDGAVRLWEVPDGRLLTTLQEHTGTVWRVALTADGQLLASGGMDGTVRIRDAPSGQPRATLDDHSGPVTGLALSADGRLLASGGLNGTVHLWDVPGGQLLAAWQGHTGLVYSVALSSDGRLLVTGSEDATVRLWELPGGQLLATLQGHTGPVYGVTLSADGRLLASGSEDATVRLWEPSSGRLLATLHGLTSGVWSVALNADARLLASGSFDGTIRLWEPGAGRLLATLLGHTRGVWGVALSGDGGLLVSGGLDGTVRLWETSTGTCLRTLQGHTGPVYGVAISADGRLLASGGLDRTVRLWEAASGRLLATLEGHTNVVWIVALSADGRRLASGSLDGAVRLWDVPGGQPPATLQGETGPVYAVALSADGRLLASGGQDGSVRLWDSSTGQLQATLEGHAGGVTGVALSADGRLLSSSSQDGTVSVWIAGTGRLLARSQGHTGGVRDVALSADGRVLASGGQDGTVRLWETSTGTCLRTLRSDRRYERADVTGLTGVTAAQHAALLALGAVDHTVPQEARR